MGEVVGGSARSVDPDTIRRNTAARRRAVVGRGVDILALCSIAQRLGVEIDAFAAVGREIEAELVALAKRVTRRFTKIIHAVSQLGEQIAFDVVGA